MIEPRQPIYEWGQRVRAVGDLRNDGTYPGVPENALLVARGDLGEIVQVGSHAESNTPVYLVEFKGDMVVGCFEEEISLVEAD
jgi:nitrogen fixation protein NifZ